MIKDQALGRHHRRADEDKSRQTRSVNFFAKSWPAMLTKATFQRLMRKLSEERAP